MGIDASAYEAKLKRLRHKGPDPRKFSDSRYQDIGGRPVGNAESNSELVAGRALEDIAISDETAQEEVVPRTDKVADSKGSPCGIVTDKENDLRRGRVIAPACSHTKVIGVTEYASENIAAEG